MQEIEFSKDLDEMNDAELRATLREFRNNYDEAKTDYDDLQNKVDEFKSDLEDAKESEETLGELQPKFASMFAEMKDLDEEMVADKFGTDELVEELEDAGAFQLDLSTDDDDVDEDEETEFSEKGQKSRKVNDETPEYQDRIDQFMQGRFRDY